jgi:hypothetical protein
MQTATRFYKGARTRLSPATPGTPLISYAPQLVFAPGFYAYNSETFDMTDPGLYAFTHYSTPGEPWDNNTHMISGNDPITLLSAAAWLSTFGDADVGKTKAQLTSEARTTTLEVLCGTLHQWVRDELLTPQGVTSRRVHFLTMGTPNQVVEGHEAVEVMIGGNWVLADLSNNCIVTDGAWNRLSADDAITAIAADDFEHEMLADDAVYSIDTNGGFNAEQYAKTHLAAPEDRKQWHRDIFQAVGLWNGSELWWKLPAGSSGRATWVESLSPVYKVKSASTWNATFY